jgi:hypothetical protein
MAESVLFVKMKDAFSALIFTIRSPFSSLASLQRETSEFEQVIPVSEVVGFILILA